MQGTSLWMTAEGWMAVCRCLYGEWKGVVGANLLSQIMFSSRACFYVMTELKFFFIR